MAEQTYKFEELSNVAKDKAIENWHGDMSVEYDIQTEYLVDYVNEHFDTTGLDVQWELYTQGSGVNIVGKIWYTDLLNKPEIVEGMTEKEVARLNHYTEHGANYLEIPTNHHYSYCKVDDCCITDDIIIYLGDYRNIDEDLIERFDDSVKKYINDLCGKLYGLCEDWEEHTWTREYMQEVCEANDYRFTEDGVLVG